MAVTTPVESAARYRSNEFPDDIIVLMKVVAAMARQLDNPAKEQTIRLNDFHAALVKLRDRAKHYYEKRRKDFGIDHIRLKRLILSCDATIREMW